MEHRSQELEDLQALQASTWVETLRDPTPKDRAAFIAWIKESPRNVRDFLLMISVDNALGHVDPSRQLDVAALLASVDRRITPFRRTRITENRVSGFGRRRWFAAAALILALVGGGFLWSRSTFEWRSFSTALGEQRAFELEDGSVINLNTNSQVAIRFRGNARDVRLLRGEALFKVHHDTARPFRVYAGDAVVQAVGTQFNVYRRAEDTIVSVIEGRVSVTAEPAAQAIAPAASRRGATAASFAAGEHGEAATVRSIGANEQALITTAGSVSIRALPDSSDAVAWRDRRLVFRQQTLEHIAEEFNRYNRTQIRLKGPDVEDKVYTGVFDVDDIDSLQQVLAHDVDLIVERSEAGIVIRHR